MRTGNPALNDKTFENFGVYRRDLSAEQPPAAAMLWAFGGAIVGLATALVICFKHTWAPMASGECLPRERSEEASFNSTTWQLDKQMNTCTLFRGRRGFVAAPALPGVACRGFRVESCQGVGKRTKARSLLPGEHDGFRRPVIIDCLRS